MKKYLLFSLLGITIAGKFCSFDKKPILNLFLKHFKTYSVTHISKRSHDLFRCISGSCKTLISAGYRVKGVSICASIYPICLISSCNSFWNVFTFVGCSVIQQTPLVSVNEEYRKLMDQHNEEGLSPEIKEDLGKIFVSRYFIKFCLEETKTTSFPCQSVQKKKINYKYLLCLIYCLWLLCKMFLLQDFCRFHALKQRKKKWYILFASIAFLTTILLKINIDKIKVQN